MKKIILAVLVLVLIFGGCGKEEVKYIDSTKGRLLVCNNTYVLIYNNTPITLNADELGDMSKYSDGDLVEVWHDAVEESYPARTKAYMIELIKEGSMADIPESVARQLCELNWIEYDDMVSRYISAGYIIDSETTENYTMCEYLYCRMGVELPEGWYKEVNKSETECMIKFRPQAEKEGWVVLQCTSLPFTVCGTGLSCEETNIGGYNASVAYYDDNEQFSFIRFDVPGEYIVRNVGNDIWFEEYENEINAILETIILSGSKLTVNDINSMVVNRVPEYESIYPWFNCFDGTWTVDVYIDSVRYQIKYDNEGNVISELTPIKN